MAYVFDSIDSALAGQTAGAGPQTDIFSAGAASAAPGAQSAGGGEIKTTTDADMSGVSGGNSASLGGQPKATINPNANAAVAKNSAEFSAMPAQYQSSVDKINNDLQSQADTYMTAQTAKGTSGNVDQATLDNAINGDMTAGSTVSGRLAQAKPTADTYQNSVDTTIEDLAALNSGSGRAGVLARNAGTDYSSGMANLDSMLLGQNQNFIKSRQDLNETQSQLKAKAAETEPVTAKAQAAIDSGFNSGTGYIKDYLGEREKAIQAAAAQRMAEYNTSLEGLRAGSGDFINSQSAAAFDDLRKRADGQEFGSYLSTAAKSLKPADLQQFYAPAAAASDASQFYTGDDATKFNLIESLLGGTNSIAAGNAMPASQSFNATGYQQAVQAKAQELQRIQNERVRQVAAARARADDQARLVEAQKAGALQAPNSGTLQIPGLAAGFDSTNPGFIFTEAPNQYVMPTAARNPITSSLFI